MIAVDSGFLYALADTGDAWHLRALSQRHTVEEGWITTWPVLVEVCDLFLRRLGTEPATVLMADVGAGLVEVWSPPALLIGDIAPLLRKYAARHVRLFHVDGTEMDVLAPPTAEQTATAPDRVPYAPFALRH